MAEKIGRSSDSRLGESKGARTKRRILDAAAGLLRSNGYAETSLADIAAAADLKTGSLAFHFATKDALVRAVFARGIELSQARLARALDGVDDPVTRLRVGIETHLESLHHHGDYAAAVIRAVDQVPSETRKHYGSREAEYVRSFVVLLRESGVLPEGQDPRLIARLLIGAMNATWDPSGRRIASTERATEALMGMLDRR